MIESDYDYRFEQPKAMVVGTCEYCGCDIMTEETYYNFEEGAICEDCKEEFVESRREIAYIGYIN